jgi:hypothetical protein
MSSTTQPFFPPINPTGISCPSDAPQIRVSSIGARMDIEFAEVTGAYAYEIEIVNRRGDRVRLEVPAPAFRAEWYGVPGRYVIRVRTINCGGLGNWSAEFSHALDDHTPPEMPPQQPQGPQCVTSGCGEPQGPQCAASGCESPQGPQCGLSGCESPQGPQCGLSGCEGPQGPQCGLSGCEAPQGPQCGLSSCEPPKGPQCGTSGCS